MADFIRDWTKTYECKQLRAAVSGYVPASWEINDTAFIAAIKKAKTVEEAKAALRIQTSENIQSALWRVQNILSRV